MLDALLFALAQSAAPEGSFVLLDRIAAVVADDVILETEIERMAAVDLVARRAGEDDASYRDRILSERIDEVVQEQQLRRVGGVEPDPREVEARLAELEKRLVESGGPTLHDRLVRARVTREEVMGWIRRGLMLATYVRERISPTIKVGDAELKSFFEGPFRAKAHERGLETLPSFPEVQEKLRELLRERKLDEAVAQWTRDLREATRILIYRRPDRIGSAGAPASR